MSDKEEEFTKIPYKISPPPSWNVVIMQLQIQIHHWWCWPYHFRGDRHCTLPVILDEDLKHYVFGLRLRSVTDLDRLRMLASDREHWWTLVKCIVAMRAKRRRTKRKRVIVLSDVDEPSLVKRSNTSGGTKRRLTAVAGEEQQQAMERVKARRTDWDELFSFCVELVKVSIGWLRRRSFTSYCVCAYNNNNVGPISGYKLVESTNQKPKTHKSSISYKEMLKCMNNKR